MASFNFLNFSKHSAIDSSPLIKSLFSEYNLISFSSWSILYFSVLNFDKGFSSVEALVDEDKTVFSFNNFLCFGFDSLSSLYYIINS